MTTADAFPVDPTAPMAPMAAGEPMAAAATSAPMYRLVQVSKTYHQKTKQIGALVDVNLTIPRGQLVAVQGPTGGGKSTLLQMLGALDRPTSGEVAFNERDVAKLGDHALTDIRATQVGFVFQSFNLIPTLNALENVECAFAGALAKRPKAEIRQRSVEALQQVGLGDRLDHLPVQLSGGQQQRVAIARALVKNPAVLLADEPTGALDEATREEIISLIERQWRERGLTVVIVTHDSWIARRAQRRLSIKQGRVRDQ